MSEQSTSITNIMTALFEAPVQVDGRVESPVALASVSAAREFARKAKSERTRRAYRSDWQAFAAWCDSAALDALPARPETAAGYAAHLARLGRPVASIGRALVAVSQAHKLAGFESPTASAIVRETVKGIRRTLGVAPMDAKAPVLAPQLGAMLTLVPEGLTGLRDRALLTLGFAGAFRRSELVALDVADVVLAPEGLVVTIRRSKTDQEAAGEVIGIPYGATANACPVRTTRAWLDGAGITAGPVLRAVDRWGHVAERGLTGHAVGLIVKRYAEGIGLDASAYGGHSLRAGLATSAAKAGKSERAIMRQTRHKSVEMVRRYIRDADVFSENAAAGLL